MNRTELIAELTEICIRQAKIIEAQAGALAQLGAAAAEGEILASRVRLSELVGDN